MIPIVKELSIEEVKKIQLSILQYIDSVCEENGIPYYLCGGTLIGAIRHKGYIPWDDDIDIMLLRPDYMKLLSLLESNDTYKCLSMYNQSDYFYPFAKVIDSHTELVEKNSSYRIQNYGVYVDIFPIDSLPDDNEKRHVHYQKILKIRKTYYLSLSRKIPSIGNLLKYPPKFCLWVYSRIKGWKYWLEKIEELAKLYSNEDSEYVGCVVAGYGEKETYHRSLYARQIKVPFEEYVFAIPQGYDEYLTCLYGDYMKLPPIEKRITRHDFVAYIIEDRERVIQ